MAKPKAAPIKPNPGDVNGSITRVAQLLSKDLKRKDGNTVEVLGDTAKMFADAVDAGDGDTVDLLMESPAKLLLSLIVALDTRVRALETRVTALEGRH